MPLRRILGRVGGMYLKERRERLIEKAAFENWVTLPIKSK
jgi:hypothetical protein